MLEFDDLMRRGKSVNASILARKWETSTKTAQRFVDEMRNQLDAPIEWKAKEGRYAYAHPLKDIFRLMAFHLVLREDAARRPCF
jgi:hypothetical protein